MGSPQRGIKTVRALMAAMACSAALGLVAVPAWAQAGDRVKAEYPQLAELLNAFDVTQAKTFEAIARINAEPVHEATRAELRERMERMKHMTVSELMAYEVPMYMTGSPYPELEVAARVNLLAVMRASYDDEAVARAYQDNAAIGRHATEVLRRGRDFENTLFEIYLDKRIGDKPAAVNAAIAEYLSDDRHSVSPYPTASRYLIEHAQANGFRTAFPRLSGLMWTQHWLQLASLEAIILGDLDRQFAGSMPVALERFWNKIGTDGGMSMFPPPSELPMTPAIAPDLFTQSPEAAIILDNLSILKTVLADILSYPNEAGLEEKMDQAVALFTSKKVEKVSNPLDYLIFALRGGIYEQGGPAVGDLTRSERNRSRSDMKMVHVAVIPGQ